MQEIYTSSLKFSWRLSFGYRRKTFWRNMKALFRQWPRFTPTRSCLQCQSWGISLLPVRRDWIWMSSCYCNFSPVCKFHLPLSLNNMSWRKHYKFWKEFSSVAPISVRQEDFFFLSATLSTRLIITARFCLIFGVSYFHFLFNNFVFQWLLELCSSYQLVILTENILVLFVAIKLRLQTISWFIFRNELWEVNL